MAEQKDFIVAIELGSSKITGVAGQKMPDGSISVLALVREESSSFIRKGVVYNIDKTAQCLSNIVKKLEGQLKTRIRQVFVGVGGQSVRGVRNTIVRDLPQDTIITSDMVASLMDENRGMEYPDQKILEVVDQEYRVDANLQIDPVGIRASRLEANFLNIVMRKSFFLNLGKSFETAGIKVVEMYVAPIELGNVVLTETEKRSGCALVDMGADTTTVAVYSKNLLRHLAVIPLGANNITKDIASLQMEESDAEVMKLKYGSAYTDSNDIDDSVKYSIDSERQVESRRFIEIIEGRLEEIVLNVREQIPNEYYDKLLGGIILTGGGSNLKNIEVAFRYHTRIDKIRTAKFVTLTINSGDSAIKAHDGMINTALGLLAKGYVNCAGGDLNTSRDLFSTEEEEEEVMDTDGQQTGKVEKPGVLAAEKARLEKERLERERLEKEKQEKEAAAEAERKKKENSLWNRFSRKLKQFGEDIVKDE